MLSNWTLVKYLAIQTTDIMIFANFYVSCSGGKKIKMVLTELLCLVDRSSVSDAR